MPPSRYPKPTARPSLNKMPVAAYGRRVSWGRTATSTEFSVRLHQRCPLEGRQHDVFVAHALLGPRLGAPLAHPHAVAPAVTFDEADGAVVVDDLEEAAVD